MDRFTYDGSTYIIRLTPWPTRLIFNVWRRPFPYLFHKWEVVEKRMTPPYHQSIAGFVTWRGAEKYMLQLRLEMEGGWPSPPPSA